MLKRLFAQENPSWIPWVLYPAGDLVAQYLIGEVSVPRLVALSLVGGLVYQYEVPAWFRWLDQCRFSEAQVERFPPLHWLTTRSFTFPKDKTEPHRPLDWMGRTLGAMVYFNPLWIARHMLVLVLATTVWSELNWAVVLGDLLPASFTSFVVNAPFSFLGNYIIQVRLRLEHRFLGSIIMTGLFSIAYALAYHFF